MSEEIEFLYRIFIYIFSERIVILYNTMYNIYFSSLSLFFILLFKKYLLLDIRTINDKCCESMKGFRMA